MILNESVKIMNAFMDVREEMGVDEPSVNNGKTLAVFNNLFNQVSSEIIGKVSDDTMIKKVLEFKPQPSFLPLIGINNEEIESLSTEILEKVKTAYEVINLRLSN